MLASEIGEDLRRPVRRAIIEHEDLVVRIVEVQHGLERLAKVSLLVPSRDDDAHAGSGVVVDRVDIAQIADLQRSEDRLEGRDDQNGEHENREPKEKSFHSRRLNAKTKPTSRNLAVQLGVGGFGQPGLSRPHPRHPGGCRSARDGRRGQRHGARSWWDTDTFYWLGCSGGTTDRGRWRMNALDRPAAAYHVVEGAKPWPRRHPAG